MESHSALMKTESNEILVSQWEPGIWNDFSGPGKIKMEPIQAMSLSEPVNKAMGFTQSETIIGDKARLIREFYKCDQCQETLTSKQTLKQHKDSVHNDKKTFRCTVGNCVRAFTSANYLKNHTDIEHTDCSESRIPCPKKDCGLVFPNNYRLKRHIRQDHKQEKLYQCQICARKFVSLEVRNNHMSVKHSSAPIRDNFPLKPLDSNYYRAEMNKESENDTVYAASPISSRFESLNGQSSIDTTCEAQWLTKTSDSNPPLSKQIDRILCDIFSDKYQDTPHSPLSSSELAIAIVSLEETHDDGKRKPSKMSPLLSLRSSPLKSSHLFPDSDRKMSSSSSSHNLLIQSSNQYSFQGNSNNVSGQNYPQSNTESEGHSTESQRSFLINSSQHEDFSDISMEGHLKDVFSSAVEKWNVYGNTAGSLDNPIKLIEYTCLDSMFDDFHEIMATDAIPTHHYPNNNHQAVANHLPNGPSYKNHLLSLNNMNSKFLSGPQLSSTDHQSNRSNTVPLSQVTPLSNYDLNRRKLNNCFPTNGIHPGPYELTSPCHIDPNLRESTYAMEISPRIHTNTLLNGSLCPPDGRMRTNYPQAYQYGSNQQLMGNNQMYYNRDPSAMYIQQPDRSPYQVCLNGPSNSNPLYHNTVDSDVMNESILQINQYPPVFRRRAPPAYQAGFSHQMLPSQHAAAAAAAASSSSSSSSLLYCPQSLQPRGNYFHPHNSSRGGLYVDSSSSVASYASAIQQQQQQNHHQRQQQRHLLSNQPMEMESQGQQSNNNHPTVAIDNNPLLECEDSIVSDEQSSPVISSETRSHIVTSLSDPNQPTSGLNQNCDMNNAKTAVCM